MSFNPHSRMGVTRNASKHQRWQTCFNPHSRMGVTPHHCRCWLLHDVSIHTPSRKVTSLMDSSWLTISFQSTPPSRKVTVEDMLEEVFFDISIHSSLAEGDYDK